MANAEALSNPLSKMAPAPIQNPCNLSLDMHLQNQSPSSVGSDMNSSFWKVMVSDAHSVQTSAQMKLTVTSRLKLR